MVWTDDEVRRSVGGLHHVWGAEPTSETAAGAPHAERHAGGRELDAALGEAPQRGQRS